MIEQIVSYLLYTLALGGALQAAINVFKPTLITPVKERMLANEQEQLYLSFFYGIRLLVTAVGYFYVWGGTEAARDFLPEIANSIPDTGIAALTIMLVVLGQEVIHPIIDWLYTIRRAITELEIEIDEDDLVFPDDPTEPPKEDEQEALG